MICAHPVSLGRSTRQEWWHSLRSSTTRYGQPHYQQAFNIILFIYTGWQGESIRIDSTGNDGQKLQAYTAFLSGMYQYNIIYSYESLASLIFVVHKFYPCTQAFPCFSMFQTKHWNNYEHEPWNTKWKNGKPGYEATQIPQLHGSYTVVHSMTLYIYLSGWFPEEYCMSLFWAVTQRTPPRGETPTQCSVSIHMQGSKQGALKINFDTIPMWLIHKTLQCLPQHPRILLISWEHITQCYVYIIISTMSCTIMSTNDLTLT